jgi:hypothetical protein
MALRAFPIVALHNVESVFSLARRIGEDLTEIETDCCLYASHKQGLVYLAVVAMQRPSRFPQSRLIDISTIRQPILRIYLTPPNRLRRCFHNRRTDVPTNRRTSFVHRLATDLSMRQWSLYAGLQNRKESSCDLRPPRMGQQRVAFGQNVSTLSQCAKNNLSFCVPMAFYTVFDWRCSYKSRFRSRKKLLCQGYHFQY